MMWDDHDIFDGAGSYPPLLHDSPMMMGLFMAAQKMRLLFQHHTTMAEKAREHQLFGHQGYNFIRSLWPKFSDRWHWMDELNVIQKPFNMKRLGI